MVAVTGSAIAIEWSALTAGSLSLSVSDHSSGSGEAEEGEEGKRGRVRLASPYGSQPKIKIICGIREN